MDSKCQICNQKALLSEGIAECSICKKNFILFAWVNMY